MSSIRRTLGLVLAVLIFSGVWVWFFSAPTLLNVAGLFAGYSLKAREIRTRGLFKYTFREFTISESRGGRGAVFECDVVDADLGLQFRPLRLRLDATLTLPRYLIGAIFHDEGFLPPQVRSLFLDSGEGIVFEKGRMLALMSFGETRVELSDFASDRLKAGCDLTLRGRQLDRLDAHLEAPGEAIYSLFPRVLRPEEETGGIVRMGFRLREGWIEITKNGLPFLRAKWKSAASIR